MVEDPAHAGIRVVLPEEPVSDGRTSLRAWREADIPTLVRACQDPDIVRFTRVPPRYGESEARQFLLWRHDEIRAGVTAPFAIVAADDPGPLLGSISLIRISPVHARAEVGYWLAPEARRQGHATRALRLICGWGFDSLGLERIELMAASANDVSQRVAARVGFTREALLRSYMEGNFGRQDMVAFGLLRGELPAAQPGRV